MRSIVCILTVMLVAAVAGAEVALPPGASPRVQYGRDKVEQALGDAHSSAHVSVEITSDGKPEGFSLRSQKDGSIRIIGNDDSGALYGCLELASRIKAAGAIPANLDFTDAPVFKLRGPCIGMQKTYILPGRKVYEYPYTPELFPFFYDKQFWTAYLDFLASNRFNSLYLWNGHPFASLVRLSDYPYALEVDAATFQQNEAMFRWIATEADRRGIRLVQMFYNILLSKPFAEHNGLSTQLRDPVPIAADYTRKSITEFIKQYPNVGLMVCLGESLQGLDNQRQWLCEVILPGIIDGIRQAGLKDEPPVILRTHATDLRKIMPDALKIYKNIYTEAKYNGESLTTWEPRGVRQKVHQDMSRLGSTHLINVHILANLEPFRYGDVDFIRKCVLAGRDRLGARGLHLYPLCYWNWPDAPDLADPPLAQIQRDWIWFEAWARYSWNPDVDQASDHEYWISRLTSIYGTRSAAEKILAAYNHSGECAPRILRRFGITEGNRQTMSLGMTLDQLVNPAKYRPFEELWESQSPPGERLQEYVQREWNHQPHEGETPPQIIEEILRFSKQASDEMASAAPDVTLNRAEFARLQNDVYCIRALSENYAAKVRAAMCVLRYRNSHDIADMQSAAKYLAESLDHFRTLANLTSYSYRFANSMQTEQRRIPFPGGSNGQPANYHWKQLLPLYQKELVDFQSELNVIELGHGPAHEPATRPLRNAEIVLDRNIPRYELRAGQKPFNDQAYTIRSVAPQLNGLSGIQISHENATKGQYAPIEFEAREPVKVLIGYFQAKGDQWLQPAELETDAAAIDRGAAEPLLTDAITIEQMPSVNIYALDFAPGRHKIDVHGRGSFVIVGVVPASSLLKQPVPPPGGH
jgi:hypothetical protein